MSASPSARAGVVALGTGVTILMHLLLGWGWTLVGGLIVGAGLRRGGWWAGGVVGLLDWTVLVGWSFWSAPTETARMAHTVGELLEGMPGVLFVGAVLGMGFALGAIGGLAGSYLGRGLLAVLSGRGSAAASS